MKALVTGGGGFIGSSLVGPLLENGDAVTCLDISSFDRLTPLAGKPKLRLVQGDVLDGRLIDELVGESDFVFHFAAVVGVDEYLRQPANVLDVNILGTRNVFHACLKHGRPILFASSSEAYGKSEGDLDEAADRRYGNTANTRWCYAVSKAAGETYAVALARQGLKFVAVRYFNVYGPLLDAPGSGRVVSKFVGCIRDKKPLPLVDGGEAVRCLCYIDDAAAATLGLSRRLAAGDEAVTNRAFNVGRREPVSMRDLARMMIDLSGHREGVAERPGRDFFGAGFEEIPYRMPDLEAIKNVLGFEAKVDLATGLAKVLGHWGLLDPAYESGNAATSVRRAIIPFVRPYFEPTPELAGAIQQSLRSGRVTNAGPLAKRFETALAEYLEAPHVALVSSASNGLLLALRALDLGAGAAVLPAFTYISTLSAVVHAGLKPIFCDIDPRRWTMSPAHLDEILSREPDVKAVLPVNVYGVPPDLERIAAAAERVNAVLVYDNAHGFGTETNSRRIAAEPTVEIFGLHATKVFPSVEGGLMVSRDDRLLDEARRLSNHGLASDPLDSTPGFNAKMSDLHAAVGLNTLKTFPQALERRRAYAERLRRVLSEETTARYEVQEIPEGVRPNHQNLAALCRFSPKAGIEETIAAFLAHGVEARRYFWPPLHQLRLYRNRDSLPQTDEACKQLLCLPLHNRMEEETLRRVEEAIRRVGRRFAP
ncbi:MAG: aminotransferase class I/II-fold pyridoxal phosphate-dependent enzyme [Myxococcales bacterium]|nr:MAG: aminotransferase class I/II-fold pyridoxal phosphate-dependent enzyme [Myxococcales bacterium]